MSYNGLGEDGARALAAGSVLRGLTALNLCGNAVGDAGIRILARSGSIAGLGELDLGENAFGVESCTELASHGALTSLTTLLVQENQLGDGGLEALLNADATRLPRLRFLDVSSNGITAFGLATTAARDFVPVGWFRSRWEQRCC